MYMYTYVSALHVLVNMYVLFCFTKICDLVINVNSQVVCSIYVQPFPFMCTCTNAWMHEELVHTYICVYP